jgi:hypothetical protein
MAWAAAWLKPAETAICPMTNAPTRIRTWGLLLRRESLYPAELSGPIASLGLGAALSNRSLDNWARSKRRFVWALTAHFRGTDATGSGSTSGANLSPDAGFRHPLTSQERGQAAFGFLDSSLSTARVPSAPAGSSSCCSPQRSPGAVDVSSAARSITLVLLAAPFRALGQRARSGLRFVHEPN